MDPNACLNEMLALSDKIMSDDERAVDRLFYADELADRVKSLNDWICNGGMLPFAWAGNRLKRTE